jgi:hypothetical protein
MSTTQVKLKVKEQREWNRLLEFAQWNWAFLEQLN